MKEASVTVFDVVRATLRKFYNRYVNSEKIRKNKTKTMPSLFYYGKDDAHIEYM